MRTGAGRPDRGGREHGTGIPGRPTPRLLAHAAGAFTQDGEARRTVGGPAESSRSCQPRPSLCCEVHADSYRGDFEENLLARRWRNPKAGNPIFFQRRLRKQALDPDGRGSHRIPARQENPRGFIRGYVLPRTLQLQEKDGGRFPVGENMPCRQTLG